MRPRKGVGARGLPKGLPKGVQSTKGWCRTCGAKNVDVIKLKHYGIVCRYCKAVCLTDIDTNERENMALMFNALEQSLKR